MLLEYSVKLLTWLGYYISALNSSYVYKSISIFDLIVGMWLFLMLISFVKWLLLPFINAGNPSKSYINKMKYNKIKGKGGNNE